jgi:hypothetical protein
VETVSARGCPRGRADAGSRRQIQNYVNWWTEELSQQVLDALFLSSLDVRLRWVSPLESEDFAEYRDEAFLHALGLEGLARKLSEFWPQGGPCWDALAVVELGEDPGRCGAMLVEAKSYPAEIYGPGCQAESDDSRTMIQKALTETKRWLGVREDVDWTGPLYQSANRLAHLYFFLQGGVPAWLVNVHFVNDPASPTTREDWKRTLAQVKAELGLAAPFITHSADGFLEVRDSR